MPLPFKKPITVRVSRLKAARRRRTERQKARKADVPSTRDGLPSETGQKEASLLSGALGRLPQPRPTPQFLRFMAASATCSLIDQLLAAFLFSALRPHLPAGGFLRITVANVLARCVSLSLNYALNHRLVFSLDVDDPEYQRSAKRESLPRFIVLSVVVLALSTLGVFCAHRLLGVAEWKAKVVIDVALFFLNYNVQRTWVFNNDVTVKVPRRRPRR